MTTPGSGWPYAPTPNNADQTSTDGPGMTRVTPYSRMPGGGISRRPLHFIILADCSGGMKGEKIQALNYAIADMMPHLAAWERDQEQAQVFVRAVAFATEPWWHIPDPQPVAQIRWKPLQPVPRGLTNMGPAFAMAAEALGPGRIERRALRPALLLITDGLATDPPGGIEAGLATLMAQPAGKAALRLAIAIGRDAQSATLDRFIGDPSVPVLVADSTTDEIATWQVITGSTRGAAHRTSGLPNQDAVANQDGPGGAVVVAIADGHGHIRHFRSAEGAGLAVEVACRVASQAAAGLAAGACGAEEAALAGQELARAVVAGWRSAVAAQLEVRPYTIEEQFVLTLAADTPLVPYGSTLLVAVIAAGWLVCAQIGDGDMLAVRPDGSSFSPVAGDDRLDGHRTTSLCQPDALASFRTGAHDLRQVPLAALLLATDGYGNAQADEPWQPGVGRDLAELAACHDRHWFEQEVPGWAQRCASAEGSGDDATIALLLPGAARDAEEGG